MVVIYEFADTSDNYLIELSKYIESDKDNRELNMLMQCVPNIERIGDYATNFDELALKMHTSHLEFSSTATAELDILTSAVGEIILLAVKAVEDDDETTARRIEPLEEVIDDMVLLMKDRHTARLCQGICSINSGLIFMEALTYLERAADQCSSIAMLILGKNNESIMKNHHQYLHELHASGDRSYMTEQELRRRQFMVPLEELMV